MFRKIIVKSTAKKVFPVAYALAIYVALYIVNQFNYVINNVTINLGYVRFYFIYKSLVRQRV